MIKNSINKHQQDSISNDSKNTRKDVNPIVHHSSDVSIVAIISFTFWAWGDVENTGRFEKELN
ncbi:hypothetical protein T06_11272 [Trichinella sp. T6]|nr:hypothetical protein T06_11272 [Trichinella sp. T6]